MSLFREDMNIVIVGHVDHGKSTIIGRLLADTKSLPEGKLEQVKEKCRRNSKPFEYAFLLDALKDEQEQGITIDAARCFFKTKKRDYIIIDAPGHIEFLKNMVTGASRAEVALLVIDAEEGIKENSKRHGYLLSMLGIKNVVVLINKMDLVQYDKETFSRIVSEYTEFLNKIDVEPKYFIPVSGFYGENIINSSEKMPWYEGDSVLEVLDGFKREPFPDHKPFRMPVQAVYKFTKDGDNRRIIAGTIETGQVALGYEIVFYPSLKKSRVKSIERFNAETLDKIGSSYAVGLTLDEQIYVKRGEIATIAGQSTPSITNRIKVNLFWLGKSSLVKDKNYILKVGSAKVQVKVEEVTKVIDASNLNNEIKDRVDRHEVAECILKTDKPISFDLSYEIAETSRFVIVDNYEIAGGGIVLKALEERDALKSNEIGQGKYNYEKSSITLEERVKKLKQKPAVIVISGQVESDKNNIAKTLEYKLFSKDKLVSFLGIANKSNSINSSVEVIKEDELINISRTSNIIGDLGGILIVDSWDLSEEEFAYIEESVNVEFIKVWVGYANGRSIDYNLNISNEDDLDEAVNKIEVLLEDKSIV